jgi:hypothetical protein
MTGKRVAQFVLVGSVLMGLLCVLGMALWRGGQGEQAVSLWTSPAAKAYLLGMVGSVIGVCGSIVIWLFSAAPSTPRPTTPKTGTGS